MSKPISAASLLPCAPSGHMTDDANREDIERALAEILIDFAARWLGKKDSVRVTFAGVGAAISSAP